MKKIILFTVLCLVIINCKDNSKNNVTDNTFTYTGANWGKYEDHDLEIVVLDTSAGSTRPIVRQKIIDGKFVVSGIIEHPQNAYFGLYDPNGDYVYKNQFIIENGALKLDLDTTTNKMNVTGGNYNDIFNSVLENPEYLAKEQAFSDFTKNLKSEDFADEVIFEKYRNLDSIKNTFKRNKFDEIRFNHTDPYARLLAILHSNRKISYEKELIELKEELGNLPEITYLLEDIKARKERKKNKVAVEVGNTIKDFSAKNLEGKEFHLADVLKENKYVLVEFWASWCGPCRGEIPHMKEAYRKHHESGFEIVYFSLDHKRERWEKASKEEGFTWINLGDLRAHKSPIVKMYGVKGIPANFLVDQSGKIIAKDLRQEKLDEKLDEFLTGHVE